ncbi:MAG TPA: STAS domain-containing protein [Solirubrobacteraceae bacterium]|nr:STAS domain-containing protein [Solirubrobacteraceae bacterium]
MDETEAAGSSGGTDRGESRTAGLPDQPHLAGLTYDVTRLPGGAERIALSGELDDFTAGLELRELFEQCAARGDDVVLDLSKVDFVDSMGLSALITAHRRLCSVGRTLVLLAPSAAVAQILQLTGLDHHIPVAARVDDVGKLLERREA